MAVDSHHPTSSESLQAIRSTLAGVRRAARAWIVVESLAIAVCVGVVGLWATLAIDRAIEPPWPVRAAMLAAVVGAVGWVLATRLVGRLAVPLGDESLALVVERTHPEFGDTLSTAVSCAAHDETTVDPDLVAQTLSAAATRLGDVRPAAIFRRRRLAGLATLAVAAVAATAAAVAARPVEATTWARRMVRLAEAPWPRRITLEPEGFADGVRVVARGAAVEVLVRAAAAWGRPPEFVELRTRPVARGHGTWRSDRMGARGGATSGGQVFGHVLEGLDDDVELEIRGGDARVRGLRLDVEEPPALASLAVRVTPPAYLGSDPREVPTSRIVTVPRGAVVELSCTATKPLAAATVSIRRTTDPGDQELARLAPEDVGGTSITARTPPLDGDTTVIVRFIDAFGLANREPSAVVLVAVPDEPPRVAVKLAGVSTVITPQAVVPVLGSVSDDHALDAVAVRLAVGEKSHTQPIGRLVAGQALVELPAARPELVPLAPAGLAVGDRVDVSIVARDRCGVGGGPQESASETWTLDVVAPETLLAMLEAREVLLRRRLETVIDDLAKARDLAAATAAKDGDGIVGRCGEAAARAAGETAEIATEFRGIRQELVTNAVVTAELELRLIGQIADPLAAIVAGELAAAVGICREAKDSAVGPVVVALDAAIGRLRTVLARMLELESINEVIERLREVIRLQEQIREDTLDRQRRRGREALESP